MTYFIAETNANDQVNNNNLWQPTSAKTLTAAKRAAARNQMFQGTALHVAEKTADGEFIPVAVKRADPINMGVRGEWENLY